MGAPEREETRHRVKKRSGGALKTVAVWVGLLAVLGGGAFLVVHIIASERAKKHERLLGEGREAEAKFDFAHAQKFYKDVPTEAGRQALEAAKLLEPLGQAFKDAKLDTTSQGLESVLKRWPGHAGATRLKGQVDDARGRYERALATGRRREEELEATAAEAEYRRAAETNVEGQGAKQLERLAKVAPTIALVKAKKWTSAMQEVITRHHADDAQYLSDHCMRRGTRLAMRGEADKKPRVRIVAPVDGKPVDVAMDHKTVLDVAWSPDGRRLSYCATGGAVQNGLYEYDIASGKSALVASLPTPGDAVSWPPGGRGPVFCGTFQDPMMQEFTGVIFAAADGKSARAVKAQTTPRNASAAPNGMQVAYQEFPGGGSEIWVAAVDGAERRRISTENVWAESPAWSPDSKWIAFAMAEDKKNFEIYVCAPDGGGLRKLTSSPEKDTHPAWSPDSASLAYVSSRNRKRVVMAMHVATGKEHVVTEVVGEVDPRPAWSPVLPDE